MSCKTNLKRLRSALDPDDQQLYLKCPMIHFWVRFGHYLTHIVEMNVSLDVAANYS